MTRPILNKLVSAYEIAAFLGCSASHALKVLRQGKFGTPINLSHGGRRMHFRVSRRDWNAYKSTIPNLEQSQPSLEYEE
jgi:hypothetical protein